MYTSLTTIAAKRKAGVSVVERSDRKRMACSFDIDDECWVYDTKNLKTDEISVSSNVSEDHDAIAAVIYRDGTMEREERLLAMAMRDEEEEDSISECSSDSEDHDALAAMIYRDGSMEPEERFLAMAMRDEKEVDRIDDCTLGKQDREVEWVDGCSVASVMKKCPEVRGEDMVYIVSGHCRVDELLNGLWSGVSKLVICWNPDPSLTMDVAQLVCGAFDLRAHAMSKTLLHYTTHRESIYSLLYGQVFNLYREINDMAGESALTASEARFKCLLEEELTSRLVKYWSFEFRLTNSLQVRGDVHLLIRRLFEIMSRLRLQQTKAGESSASMATQVAAVRECYRKAAKEIPRLVA